MGQWPVLLTLPGFSFHPAAAEETEFLWSSAFAQANADQASRMGIPFEAGRITAITGNDESGFELELTSGHRLSAAYVDICGGPALPECCNAPPVSTRRCGMNMRRTLWPG